jgi:hypothetical protein
LVEAELVETVGEAARRVVEGVGELDVDLGVSRVDAAERVDDGQHGTDTEPGGCRGGSASRRYRRLLQDGRCTVRAACAVSRREPGWARTVADLPSSRLGEDRRLPNGPAWIVRTAAWFPARALRRRTTKGAIAFA